MWPLATAYRTLRYAAILAALVCAAAQTIEHEAEREHWQQISEIFKAMDVHSGSVVADVGAGDGFLSVRLAPLVGETGRVYAEDISKDRLERLRKRLADAHLDNVVTVDGSGDDPHLPTGQLDAVVIVNAYHEMSKYAEMLRHIHESLKPGGRVVIAEPSPLAGEDTRELQVAKHHIAASFVAGELKHAGFEVIELREKFAHIPDGPIYYSIVVGRI